MPEGVLTEPTDSPFRHFREEAVGFGVTLARVLGQVFGSLPRSTRLPSSTTTTTPAPAFESLAGIARSVDESLPRFSGYPGLMTQVWEDVCEDVASGRVDTSRGGETLREAFSQAAELLTSTRDALIRRIEEEGFPLSNAVPFRRVVEETLRLTERYLGRWALIDPGVIQAAGEEHRRGDYPSPGVALADLLAAKHAEQALPSYEGLKTWADHASPPPSWFEEKTE